MDQLVRAIGVTEQFNNAIKKFEIDGMEVGGATSSGRFSPPTSTTLSPEPVTSVSSLINGILEKNKYVRAMGCKSSSISANAFLLKEDKSRKAFNGNLCDSVSYYNGENEDDLMEGLEEGEESNNPPSTSKLSPSSSSLLLSELSAAAAAMSKIKSTNAGDKEERPSLSYKDLIIEAIESSPEKRLKLSEIYQVIRCLHPYYLRRADQWGWQNSIRHNLSLHDCFIKLPLKQTSASGVVGHFWTVVRESDDKQGSPTRRRSRANNGINGGNSKHSKLNNIKHTDGNNSITSFANNINASTIASSSLVLSPSSSIMTSSAIGCANSNLKIKDRQSVSSDSGVMSDESQSSSPTTSTATLLQNGIINGILNASIAAGNNVLEMHNEELRKNSSSIFACPTTTVLNGLKGNSGTNSVANVASSIASNLNSLVHQHQQHAANSLNSLHVSQSQTTSSLSSNVLDSTPAIDSNVNLANANVTALAALLQQTTGQLPTAPSSLAQLLEATSKSRLLSDILQQHSNGNVANANNGLINNETLNNLLSPTMMMATLANPTSNIAASPFKSSPAALPLRLAALNSLLNNVNGNQHIMPTSANNGAGALDMVLSELLSTAPLPLSTNPLAPNSGNIAGELQRLQFIQFCMYQQALLQQLVTDNSNNSNSSTPGILGLNNMPNPAEQLAAILTHNQSAQQENHNSTSPPTSKASSNILSQLLLTKLANAISSTTSNSQVGVAISGVQGSAAMELANAVAGNGANNAFSSSQQQLLDALLHGQRQMQLQQQHNNNNSNSPLKIATINNLNEINQCVKKEVDVDTPKNARQTSSSLGSHTKLDTIISNNLSLPISLQQQQAMTSLIEQYMLKNGLPSTTTPAMCVTPTATTTIANGEGVVSTTTNAALSNLALSPNSTTLSPKPLVSNSSAKLLVSSQKEQQQQNQQQLAI